MDIVRDFAPEHLDYWSDYECKVAVFTTPDERAVNIEPAVGIVTQPTSEVDLGVPAVRVAWKPSQEDIDALSAGGTLWLSTWGGLPPHMLEVQPPVPAVVDTPSG